MNKLNKAISITFMSGPYDGKTLNFDQPEVGDELVLKIGRRDDCEIHLPYDSQVSRLHAALGCKALPASATDSAPDAMALSFWLEDSGSRNGTFIDKLSITERRDIRPGTLFRVGRTWMRLDVPLSYGIFGDNDDDADDSTDDF